MCTAFSNRFMETWRKTVAKISWDSPKMQEIEKEWHSLWDAYDKNPEMIPGDNGITRYINVVKIVHNLLGRRLSDKELRQLVAACDTLPADIENAGFVRDALAFMVKSFADSEDRESLVTLLSRRCPCHVDERGTIECVLAFDAKRLGNATFAERLERAIGRVLRPRKAGRPSKLLRGS